MEMIRVGIIGLGNIGTAHAKNYCAGNCPDFELTAIADINPDRIQWGKENLQGNIHFFPDAMEMLDSGLIDACMVCVPHYDHPKYAMECMRRGLHVMCEKPAAVYTKQAREMMAEADKHPELKFGMMFNQRTNCVYRAAHELIHSGRLGQIRRVNWIITDWFRSQLYFDSGNWRATWAGEGGGVLMNQCPHQLDLLQWLCGMPKLVDAHLHFGKWHDIEVEDDVTAYMEFPNGATGVFITTTGDGQGSNRLEIQLEKGRMIITRDEIDLVEFDRDVGEYIRNSNDNFEPVASHKVKVEMDGENPQHKGVVNAWGKAILHGTPLVADGREGINGLMLSNAMHLSAFLGKPVELPIDEELYYNELMKRVATSRLKTNVKTVYADTSKSYGV